MYSCTLNKQTNNKQQTNRQFFGATLLCAARHGSAALAQSALELSWITGSPIQWCADNSRWHILVTARGEGRGPVGMSGAASHALSLSLSVESFLYSLYSNPFAHVSSVTLKLEQNGQHCQALLPSWDGACLPPRFTLYKL